MSASLLSGGDTLALYTRTVIDVIYSNPLYRRKKHDERYATTMYTVLMGVGRLGALVWAWDDNRAGVL